MALSSEQRKAAYIDPIWNHIQPLYFEEFKIKYEYEQHTFVLLPAFTFSAHRSVDGRKISNSIRQITYTPDFVGDKWIIETKGIKTPDFMLKWKLFKKYCLDNNMPHQLYLPRNQAQVRAAIEDILLNERKC